MKTVLGCLVLLLLMGCAHRPVATTAHATFVDPPPQPDSASFQR